MTAEKQALVKAVQRQLFASGEELATEIPPALDPVRFAFFVAGEPRPKGSKTAFVVKGPNGPRAIVTDVRRGTDSAQRMKSWASTVTAAAFEALGDADRITTPLSVALTFYLSRPGGHFNAKGALRPAAPKNHGTKPDVDKLSRSTLDALKVGMLSDDSRIWRLIASKKFVGDDGTRQTGCWIVVEVTP